MRAAQYFRSFDPVLDADRLKAEIDDSATRIGDALAEGATAHLSAELEDAFMRIIEALSESDASDPTTRVKNVLTYIGTLDEGTVPSQSELLLVAVQANSALEYLGNRIYEQAPRLFHRDEIEAADRCLNTAIGLYVHALEATSNIHIKRRLHFKILSLQSLWAGLEAHYLVEERKSEALKREYERLTEATDILLGLHLPKKEPRTLSLADKAAFILQALLSALKTIASWPIQFRYVLYRRLFYEFVRNSFELNVYQGKETLTEHIFQTGKRILDEYLSWLLDRKLGFLALKVAVEAAGLTQHRLKDLDTAKTYYQRANDLIGLEIDAALDLGKRRTALSYLYEQSLYLRILQDRTGLRENLDLTVRLLQQESQDHGELGDHLKVAEISTFIAFKLLIAGQLVSSAEICRMSAFYFQKAKLLWKRFGSDKERYRLHEADGFGSVAIARALIEEQPSNEADAVAVRGITQNLSSAIYHLNEAASLTFSEGGSTTDEYGDAALFCDGINHIILARQAGDILEIMALLNRARANFSRAGDIVAHKIGVRIAKYYEALLEVLEREIKGEDQFIDVLDTIRQNFAAEGLPYREKIMDHLHQFLQAQSREMRGEALISFLDCASRHFLYLPTLT